MRLKSASNCEICSSVPSHRFQPAGAKLPAKSLISPMYGWPIFPPPCSSSRGNMPDCLGARNLDAKREAPCQERLQWRRGEGKQDLAPRTRRMRRQRRRIEDAEEIELYLCDPCETSATSALESC